MLDSVKYRGRSINLSMNGYSQMPSRVFLDDWKNVNNVYAFRLLFKLIELTPYKDSKDWSKGILEISSVDLAKELGWSRNTLYKTIQTLVDDGIIYCSANKGRENITTFTFCDYDGMFYTKVEEEKCSPDEQPTEVKCSPDEQLSTIKCSRREQHNNYNNNKNKDINITTSLLDGVDEVEKPWCKKKSRYEFRSNAGSHVTSDGMLKSDALDAFDFRGSF